MSRSPSFGQLGRELFLSLVLVAFAAPAAFSQTSTGSIRGYVKDATGAPLSGATIEARNEQSGVARTATSQADGSYALPGLVPGAYNVTARHIGHTAQGRRVVVQIGASLLLDFALQAGAVEVAGVTVQVAAAVTETRTSEVATNVTQQQIERLPTTSRNFLDLAALAPGISVSEDRINPNANSISPRNFSAGAQGPNDINIFIDGASLKNDLTGGGVAGQDNSRGNPFPRNAIQEYRVISQNFKAEYQKSSSAIITATTKSGGNVWTGNAYFSYQNKDLVALDTFQVVAKHVADSIANKTGNPSTFNKPDYSRSLVGVSVGGPLIKDRLHFFGSYEGNYQNRANLVNITPRTPGLFPALDTVSLAKYNGNFQSPFRETLLFGKLSYAVSGHSTAELSFNNRHETDVRDFGDITAFQSAIDYRNDIAIGTLKYNYFTGPWLSEATVTYQRFRRNPTPDTPGVPQRWFNFGCCVTIGSNLSSQDFTQRRLGLRDDVTYTGWHAGGDHMLKAGGNVDFLNYDVDKENRVTPQFFYADTIDRGGKLAFNYRSPFQVVWQSGNPLLKADNTQIGAYLQDDWSPTPQLTLNLGVRWDFESHMLNYDYVTPRQVRDTIGRYYNTLLVPIDTTRYFTDGTQRKKFYGAFQPRLGFSYALDPENRTTLFGGFGIFYDRSYFDISVDETLKLTRPEYTILFAHPDSTPKASEVAWNNSYLTTNPAVLNTLVANGQAAGKEVWLIANDAKAPKSTQWNVGVRRQLGDFLVSAAYVGARGHDQLVFNWANLLLNANGGCCVGGSFGHGFSNILYTTSSGKTWYDALQVQVNRPYRRTENFGWAAGLAYTYATRSLEGVDNPDDQFAFTQATRILKHPANDEKSHAVANWTIDVPYAYGVQFSGLITLGSGQLLNIGDRFNQAGFQPGAFSPPKHFFIIPGAWRYRRVDLRLRKDFPNVSGTTLGVTVDLFNAFNFQNFGSFNTDKTSAQFGVPTGLVSDPRRLQIGAEYSF